MPAAHFPNATNYRHLLVINVRKTRRDDEDNDCMVVTANNVILLYQNQNLDH